MPLCKAGEIDAGIQAVEQCLHLCAGGNAVGIAEPRLDEDVREFHLFGHPR